MPNGSVSRLLKSRRRQYQDSWKKHGKVLQPLMMDIADMWVAFPEALLPWMMIFNKLLRILAAPYYPDNWRDIIGYATLVLEHLKEEKLK